MICLPLPPHRSRALWRAAAILLAGSGLLAQTARSGEVRRLSLQEALTVALENNYQVQVARETRTAAAAAVPLAAGAFDWNLFANLSYARQDLATTRQLYPTGPLGRTEATVWNKCLALGTQKAFEWGGSLQMSYNPSSSFTEGSYHSPSTGALLGQLNTQYPYTGSFTGTYTQNLLRGFGRQVTEVNVIVARKGAQAADDQFRLALVNLVAAVEAQYWDLVYAGRNLGNAETSLALAQQQLDDDRALVGRGQLPGIEVVNAQAAVAQRQVGLIVARSQLRNAQDTLRRSLYPQPGGPERIDPTDQPAPPSAWAEEAAAEQAAVDHRLELKVARLARESMGALRAAAENRLLPQLNTFVSYNALSDNQAALGPVNTDLTHALYPGYAVGLTFSLPLGNRSAKGSLSQAKANERASDWSLRDLEQAIRLQVRTAFENVAAARESVAAAVQARQYREEDLRGEKKRFDQGMSTTFLVLAKQNDLDSARATELQARIGHAKAATALELATGHLLEARGFAAIR